MNRKYIGKKIFNYEKIDSTQKEIWRRIENNNIENGTVITAQIQKDAIGTHGRIWYTEKENNIAFSIALFPNCDIKKLDNLTYEIAEIFTYVFEKLYNIKLEIKIPNDLVIRKRKVGGILTETKLQGSIVKTLVIGIGINTNQIQFSKEIEDIATSIKNEFDIEVNNQDVINEFLNVLEEKIEKRIGEK